MPERTYNHRFTKPVGSFKAGDVATPDQIVAAGHAVKDLWNDGAIVTTGEAPTSPEKAEKEAHAAGDQP